MAFWPECVPYGILGPLGALAQRCMDYLHPALYYGWVSAGSHTLSSEPTLMFVIAVCVSGGFWCWPSMCARLCLHWRSAGMCFSSLHHTAAVQTVWFVHAAHTDNTLCVHHVSLLNKLLSFVGYMCWNAMLSRHVHKIAGWQCSMHTSVIKIKYIKLILFMLVAKVVFLILIWCAKINKTTYLYIYINTKHKRIAKTPTRRKIKQVLIQILIILQL